MTSKLSKIEQKALFSLASIMSLRMLGLFMVVPLFTLYVSHLTGATPALMGTAMGIYGLSQAFLQIPFGIMSDHFGRKRLIMIGLFLFIGGSIVCALSQSIWGILIGRALQGAGAVGSTIMALIADLTRLEQRTKAMAITGVTIGFSFSLAMVLGPILAMGLQVTGIFWLSALLGGVAIVILYGVVPNPETVVWHEETEPQLQRFPSVLKNSELSRLNGGVFLLHAIFTASFVVIPIHLHHLGLTSSQQWTIYLPTLGGAFLLVIPLMMIAEKKHTVRLAFLGGVILLMVAQLFLWFFTNYLLLFALNLLLFFTAFSLLEAFLPSLVSKAAPKHRKGTALGIYSFSQFLGIFTGGTLGGWLYGYFGLTQVHLFCAALALLWLGIAFKMKNPQYSLQRIA